MPKGNHDNHPNKKYAQVKDLERLEGKFDKFLDNEHPHLVEKVDDVLGKVSRMNRQQWITTGILIVGVPLLIMLVQMVIQGFIKP